MQRKAIVSTFSKYWFKLILLLAPDAKNTIERQRLSIFVYTLLLLIGILPFQIAGLIGYQDEILRMINIGWFVLQFLFIAGLLTRRLRLGVALVVQLFVAQARFSTVILLSTLLPTADGLNLIWINLTFSLLAVFLSLLAHLRNIPFLLAGITIGTYIAMLCLIDNQLIVNYSPTFIFIFALTAILGKRLMDGIQELQQENVSLRNEEERIEQTIGLSKAEMLALADLTSTHNASEEDTKDFIEMLNYLTRERLFTSVARLVRIRETEIALMERVFPELSASEHEICRLILQGKKQYDVCAVLGKTKGNITSQRTHIRTKLGLKPNEKLSSELYRRLGQYYQQAARGKR